METKKLKFKTNINCSGCVAKVKPFLDELEGVETWQVDTDDEQKILSVTTNLNEEDIIDTIEEIGFNAEPIEN